MVKNRPPHALALRSGTLTLPVFLPDATAGVVRALDTRDLLETGVQGLVMNVFHLMLKPGSSVVQELGGLHTMSAWPWPIMTDSGGFQAYSILRERPERGSVTDKGLTIRDEQSDRKFILTPEKCIQLQTAYDADILTCLDECTHADAPHETQRRAVERTLRWAARCRAEHDEQTRRRQKTQDRPPLLFGVVQGGNDTTLRRTCAERLLEIGFDGFGFGGWPMDADGALLTDILEETRERIPPQYPMHALGVGHPKSIVACARIGYSLFDSALPTRDARHGRLYLFTEPPETLDLHASKTWFDTLYIQDSRHIRSKQPLSPLCDCLTCSRYSVGYLHHLFVIQETLYFRLATIHNLRFMTRLMETLSVAHAHPVPPYIA